MCKEACWIELFSQTWSRVRKGGGKLDRAVESLTIQCHTGKHSHLHTREDSEWIQKTPDWIHPKKVPAFKTGINSASLWCLTSLRNQIIPKKIQTKLRNSLRKYKLQAKSDLGIYDHNSQIGQTADGKYSTIQWPQTCYQMHAIL